MKKCCFIGHRKILKSDTLEEALRSLIVELIDGGVGIFIFGDHSEFDDLCYTIVTELKLTYPNLQRVKYRTEHPQIGEDVRMYFLSGLEDNICPSGVERAGRLAYIKRNEAMIYDSDYCVFYYDGNYKPKANTRGAVSKLSGTGIAYSYACRLKKKIINVFECCQ